MVHLTDFGGVSSRTLKGVRLTHSAWPRSWILGESCITNFRGVGAPGACGGRAVGTADSITAAQFCAGFARADQHLLSWLTSTSTTYPSTIKGYIQVVGRVCKTVDNGLARRIAEVVRVASWCTVDLTRGEA